jgi:hypothetical protein
MLGVSKYLYTKSVTFKMNRSCSFRLFNDYEESDSSFVSLLEKTSMKTANSNDSNGRGITCDIT